MTTPEKPSALSNLRSLYSKKPVPAAAPAAIQNMADPAIAGARLKGSTVILGEDPSITKDAAYAAELRQALEVAQSNFEVYQSRLRDYGREKREVYNDTFKAEVTTVSVPYKVEVPADPNSKSPGYETKFVQVICSNKYSVHQETILRNRDTIGPFYGQLFVEERKKVLKPNMEELLRGLLTELGVGPDELEAAVGQLFEEQVKVSASKSYEQEIKKTPEDLQAVLGQAVTRVSPGLKFDL